MTFLRRPRDTSPSRSARVAPAVENRSSHVSTGTGSRFSSAAASASTRRAIGPTSPASVSGSPTTTRAAPSAATSAAIASTSFASPRRGSVSRGCAARPSSSDTATPIVLVPTSSPTTRTSFDGALLEDEPPHREIARAPPPQRERRVAVAVAERQAGDGRDVERRQPLRQDLGGGRRRPVLLVAAQEIPQRHRAHPVERARQLELRERPIDPVGALADVLHAHPRPPPPQRP